MKNIQKIGLKNVAWEDGKYFVSWNLDSNISSFGDTEVEAFESLREALLLSRE